MVVVPPLPGSLSYRQTALELILRESYFAAGLGRPGPPKVTGPVVLFIRVTCFTFVEGGAKNNASATINRSIFTSTVYNDGGIFFCILFI